MDHSTKEEKSDYSKGYVKLRTEDQRIYDLVYGSLDVNGIPEVNLWLSVLRIAITDLQLSSSTSRWRCGKREHERLVVRARNWIKSKSEAVGSFNYIVGGILDYDTDVWRKAFLKLENSEVLKLPVRQ